MKTLTAGENSNGFTTGCPLSVGFLQGFAGFSGAWGAVATNYMYWCITDCFGHGSFQPLRCFAQGFDQCRNEVSNIAK